MSQSKTVGVRGGRYVVVLCEWCGKSREVPYEHRMRRFCPKPASCCYDYLKRPKAVLTDEQRYANEMLRRQRSAESRRGQVVSQERRDKTSATLKRRYAAGEISVVTYEKTPEIREKISKSLLEGYRSNRIALPCGSVATEYEGAADGPRIKMRSRSEVAFAVLADSLSIKWSYEPQRFDLGWSAYVPDFYLPEYDHWVEIKGYFRPDNTALRKVWDFSKTHSLSLIWARHLLRQGSETPKTLGDILEGHPLPELPENTEGSA